MVIVIQDGSIWIERLDLGPFGTNAYILVDQNTLDSVVIDAPADAGTMVEKLRGTTPRYILLTHNHMDHLGAMSELRSRLRVPLGAHPADSHRLSPPPEIALNDGDTISFGDSKLEVLHTPGHTPGSLCFRVGKYLIAGDTVFPGGPGKTGSPDNLRQIIESITGKIYALPDDTGIYPGHGDSATVKQSKGEFAVFSSRLHDQNLCGDVLWLTS